MPRTGEASQRPMARTRGRRTIARRASRLGALAAAGVPSYEDIVEAASSLLHDELRPYGRLLRKRLSEGTDTPSEVVPLSQLRTLCEECPGLTVAQEGEAEWFINVEGLNVEVVDIYAEGGDFSDDFWREAAEFLRTPHGGQLGVAGGRYVCARNLMRMNPPFLRGLSLGKVTQFVQMAMSTKKLLGYRHGSIVPYDQCDALLKEQCAEQRMLTSDSNSLNVYSWETLRIQLRTVLEECSSPTKARGGVPLSNIKRLLRNRFLVDFTETSLGHRALADVFKDARLKDVCCLKLLDNGYYLYLVNGDTSTEDEERVGSKETSLDEAVPYSPTRMPPALASPSTLTSTTPVPRSPVYSMAGGIVLGNSPAATFPTLDSPCRFVHGDASERKPMCDAVTRPIPTGDASERAPPQIFGDAGDRKVPQFFLPTWAPVSTTPAPRTSDLFRTEAGNRPTPSPVLLTPSPSDNVKFFDMLSRAVHEENTAPVVRGVPSVSSTLPPSCPGSEASSRESSRAPTRAMLKKSGAVGSSERPRSSDSDNESEAKSPVRVRNTFIEIEEPSVEDESPRRRAMSLPRFIF